MSNLEVCINVIAGSRMFLENLLVYPIKGFDVADLSGDLKIYFMINLKLFIQFPIYDKL